MKRPIRSVLTRLRRLAARANRRQVVELVDRPVDPQIVRASIDTYLRYADKANKEKPPGGNPGG
jgi:hypothetical protein